MDLHLTSHHWERRQPDWSAAAVSGLAAGAVLMVLELLWSSVLPFGTNPWATSHMVAAIAMGRGTLEASGFAWSIVIAALATHYVLGVIFGLLLASIIAPFHLDSSPGLALSVGALFGLALYVFDFYAMTRFFSWFIEARGVATLLGHLLFGMTMALLYWKLSTRTTAQQH